MQLILDAGFPVQCEVYGHLDLQLVRWSAEQLDDVQLVEAADRSGVSGLILLGSGALNNTELLKAARERGLYLAATYESSPSSAMRALSNNLTALRRRVRAQNVDVIYARDIKSFGDKTSS